MKWTDERSGSFVSDNHGRDHDLTVEVALDEDGTFHAVRLNGFADLGGYSRPSGRYCRTFNLVKNVTACTGHR